MRLILISQDFPPEIGGIQTYSYELAIRFSRKFDYFSVIAPLKRRCEVIDDQLDFTVDRINISNTLLPYGMYSIYPALVKEQSTELSFHSQWQTIPSAIWAKKYGFPKKIFVAAHARELLFNPYGDGLIGKWYVSHRRKVLHQVDHFFPVSHYTADLLHREGIPKARMTIIPNGTDPQNFRPVDVSDLKKRLGLQGKKILLTTTRLVSRKGIDTVIRSLETVKEKHPDIIYLVVGDGPEHDNLVDLVERYNLTDSVIFTGKIPYGELTEYYNLCDVFIMPSKTQVPDVEGFGIVFLEAGACSKPVIGSFSGGIPDAILNKKTGLLVEESNETQLAQAINSLLDNPEWAKKLGKQGRERILKEANWDAIANKMYQKIVELSE